MASLYSFPWHNDNCIRDKEHIEKNGNKRFFCKTHNQWASEIPVRIVTIYHYGDGTIKQTEKENKE